jgi:3-deoxy-D-manno-octulosonic-acid transferase
LPPVSLGGTATRLLGAGLAALLPAWLRMRARRGKEIAARLAERRGLGAQRPEGPLLWLHAASVGESLSLLPLLSALAARRPELHFLVTTGTVTSAKMLLQRLPPELANRVIHRFVPLDVPRWGAAFLDGWRPDAAVFVESDLWPNLTAALQRRGIPMALINGSISARSARMWSWMPGLAREMLGRFHLIAAQSKADAARLRGMGAREVVCWGNLKASAAPLPADPAELARLRAMIGSRPVFLAASTHPGEDEAAIEAHRAAAATLPELLTIIAPRHPQRGAAIAALATTALGDPGAVNRRSLGGLPDAACRIHVADTMGELGLFFRLAGAALVGGSLVPKGGHNPLEPARLECPILIGPYTEQFQELVADMEAAGGVRRVADRAVLAETVAHVLSSPERAQALTRAATRIAAEAKHLPDRLAVAILETLPTATGTLPDVRGA